MAGSKMSKNGNAKSVSKQVAQILNSRVEHKLATSTTPSISWTTAGTVSELSTDIAQGDNLGNRNGDTIRPLRLNFRMTSQSNGTATGHTFRVIAFQDTMSSGAAPSVTAVLNSADNIAFYNPVTLQAKRFKILADFTGTNVGGTNNQELAITKSFKLKGMIHFVGTVAGAASAGKNSIYVLFISNLAGASITYKWAYELEYIDA